MAADYLRRFAIGGGARPDALTGLNPQFAGSIASMFQAAPPEVQAQLRISSAYRSPQRQAEILASTLGKRVGGDAVQQWNNYVQQAGGDAIAAGEAARPWLRSLGITKWVAPPGSSNHQKGVAVDLQQGTPEAKQWMHANAPQFGLHFPMKHEDWHLEPADARNMGGGRPMQMPAAVAGGSTPTTQPGQALPMMAQAGAPAPQFLMDMQAAPPMPGPSPLAAMFAMEGEVQKRKAAEKQAEAQRRAALFGGPSPFG